MLRSIDLTSSTQLTQAFGDYIGNAIRTTWLEQAENPTIYFLPLVVGVTEVCVATTILTLLTVELIFKGIANTFGSLCFAECKWQKGVEQLTSAGKVILLSPLNILASLGFGVLFYLDPVDCADILENTCSLFLLPKS